jgi:hypothetical protein
VNEESPPNSSLDLTLTQHPLDEDLEPWKVHPHLEVEPPQTWYYHIPLNSHTLVILLQINPTYGDEPKNVYEGFYKIEYTSIFAWFSIRSIGHYRWLCNLICWLIPNSKSDYLICTIQHILNFMQLWIIIMA